MFVLGTLHYASVGYWQPGNRRTTPAHQTERLKKELGRFCISKDLPSFFSFKRQKRRREVSGIKGRGRGREEKGIFWRKWYFFRFESKKEDEGEEDRHHAMPQYTLHPRSEKPTRSSSSARAEKLTHLFLGVGLLLGLSLGASLTLAAVAGLSTRVTELAVSSLLTLGEGVTLDLSDGLLGSGVGDGESSTNVGGDTVTGTVGQGSLDGLDVLGGGVELLELTALAGEEDQASLVVLEAGNVGDQGLLGVVDTAVVNGDTDGGGELLGNASLLYHKKIKA